MTQWATFAGLVGVVLCSLLVLSQLTERSLTPADAPRPGGEPAARDASGPSGESAVRDPSTPGDDPAVRDASGPSGESAVRDSTAGVDPEGETPPGPDRATDRGQESAVESGTADGPEPADDGAEPADDGTEGSDRIPPFEGPATGPRATERDADGPIAAGPQPGSGRYRREGAAAYVDGQPVSTTALLVNVAVTQGLFAAIVIGAAIYTGIPADALGIAFGGSALRTGLLGGLALGLGLYVANEVGAAVVERTGIEHSEALREMLAPTSAAGWAALLGGVLPLIAVFEELLFRAAIVGALSAGFGLSPWLLAVVSSVAFAVGHGVQGTAGVVVTGLLGFVLAAAFVLTGNLWLVVVAHYLINALEFAVHEGLGIDWADVALGGAEPKG